MSQNYAASAEDSNDVTLHLNRAHLLVALTQLTSADSVGQLRDAVSDLQAHIRNPDSAFFNDVDAERSVAFDRKHLCEALDQIAASRTLERARYYVDRLIKSISEVRTSRINDINLNRWKEYEHIFTDSLWVIDRRDNSGVHTAGYWGNFIPQIPRQMMLRYTKKGEWVLDPFAGCGTTAIEGQRLGRNSVGVELQADVAEQARLLIAAEPNPYDVVSEIATGDSRTVDFHDILARHGQHSVQLVVMHPPYFDIIKFSDDPRDLSNADSVDCFLRGMAVIVEKARDVLDRDRYLALVIGDKYAQGEWIPLGFLTMNEITQRGFVLKSIIVKNFDETTGKRSQKELWRYRALAGGFYIFKHEYIFVFRKG